MKIYTKKGDKGETRMLFGDAVSKDDLAPDAYGSVDELVAALGLIRADKDLPIEVQENFVFRVREFEQMELEFFVVPGENNISAKFDWARVVSRRAERKCVRWQKHLEINDSEVVVYLNRLSDLLWMLAREFENDWTPSK